MANRLKETESIPAYVSALTRRLQRELPPEKTSEIVEETAAHLEDRREALQELGCDPNTASHLAARDFLAPSVYSRAMIDGVYETRIASHWRRRGRLASVAAFCILALPPFFTAALAPYLSDNGRLWLGAFGALILAAFVCAIGGRRSQTRWLLSRGAFGTLCAALAFGMVAIKDGVGPTSRFDAPAEFGDHAAGLRYFQKENALLETGVAYFRHPAGAIPAALRAADGRVIVPRPVADDGLFESAFKALDRRWARIPHHYYNQYQTMTAALTRQPYATVAVAEARRRWLQDGPRWIKEHQASSLRFFAYRTTRAERLRIAPWLRFDLRSAGFLIAVLGIALTLFLLVDVIGASIGRRLFRRRFRLAR